MARWDEVAASEPEFAERVKARFDAGIHKTMATLRKDGSPRISGTETEFSGGEIWLGMMPGSLKALDLRRDPRIALHSPSTDPSPDGGWAGEAKLSGRAVEVDPRDKPAGGAPVEDPSHLFRIDITEVVLTYPGTPPDHLLIELWREGEGLRRIERR